MSSQRLRARAFFVTLLDVGLIIAGSAALVVLLGGRTRPDLAGVRITIRSASNLIAFAAGFGALRLFIGGRSRALPGPHLPGGGGLYAARVAFASLRRPNPDR